MNGNRDLVQLFTGRDWSNEFVYGLGQGGGFAYLRFKSADPPRLGYWGIATIMPTFTIRPWPRSKLFPWRIWNLLEM
ncbi:MAG: hypothetical protein JXA42_03265 [Anaerolineales bacterium]|nr:hypothetical protein [Anaerolineales bacterium]